MFEDEKQSDSDNKTLQLGEYEQDYIERDLERARILEKIHFLDRRIKKFETRKRELEDELEKVLHVKSLSEEMRKNYLKRLVEYDKMTDRDFGTELEKSVIPRSSYPIRGIFSVGVALLTLLGFLMFLPIEIPPTLRFVFGPWLLLIGFSVLLIWYILKTRP